MKSIVTIGGGTGQFTLLSGLKKYPVHLTAIVSMADDGGSTGILRDELGVLPPGDVRQCLVALSEADDIMRQLFNYRFAIGGMKGHNFGNLFLSALEKITGSFEDAVQVSSKVLAIRGIVIPVTTRNVALVCGRGHSICVGEHAINTASKVDRASLRLEPKAKANPKAISALTSADCIVIGPGNLYCSIIPNLLVKGIPEAIRRSRANVVYNCNLMTKKGHTDDFTVVDFLDEIERYIGVGRVDYMTYNRAPLKPNLVARYVREGAPVSIPDRTFCRSSLKLLSANLVSKHMHAASPGDAVHRSLIRHDHRALARLIMMNCVK